MDATRIDIGDARPLAVDRHRMGIETPSESPAMALASTWSAIHDAAATLGVIAGIDPMRLRIDLEHGLQACVGRQSAGIGNEVHDLADIMQRGIAALLTAHTSGGAPQAAARTLWDEFLFERDAVLMRLSSREDDRRA